MVHTAEKFADQAMPETGQPAPDFTAPADSGDPFTLSAQKGKAIVLYFYPKDDTPGCTTEAKDFRDLYPQFQKAGAEIVGVSKDNVTRHDKFKCKYDLPFPLISDAESDICERYGVWGKKSMYGKSFMGITRATFLIDKQGFIKKIWPKVSVGGHAEEVLQSVRELN